MSTDEYVYIIPRYYVDERCTLILALLAFLSYFSFATPWLDFASKTPDLVENALARRAFHSAIVVGLEVLVQFIHTFI